MSLNLADIVLVPLVAWDADGHRLGYGKGYFDKALAANTSPTTIGLAFEAQRSEMIPQSPTDVALEIVVTEEQVLRVRRGD